MVKKVDASDIPLEIYFREISRYSPLSYKEEIELIHKAKKGDKTALEKIVLSNLRFVVDIAARYRGLGVPIADLINEGNLGLIKAVKFFDPKKGVKFLSYAVWWIRQAILRALDEQGQLIRLPGEQRSRLRKVKKAEKDFLQKHGTLPSIKELKEITGLKEDEIKHSLKIFQKELSLNIPLGQEEDKTLLDVMEQKSLPSPEEFFKKEHLKASLEQAFKVLNEREKKVIKLYFGFDDQEQLTYEEIGMRIGLSRERVRQIKEEAFQKLRTKLGRFFWREVDELI